MLAWCVVCVFGDVHLWRVRIFHWNVPNQPRGQDHAGGTPGKHACTTGAAFCRMLQQECNSRVMEFGVFRTVCRRTMCVYIYIYIHIYLHTSYVNMTVYISDGCMAIYMYITDSYHDSPWHGSTHKNCPLCILDIYISSSYVHTYLRGLSYINRW